MVLVICRAAKKAWFRTIQEVYCWGERIPRWLCKLKPSIAEQAEKQLGLQSVPSAWLVALWNLTELQRELTSGQRLIRKSWLEDLPLLYLSSSTYVVFSSGTRRQSSDRYSFLRLTLWLRSHTTQIASASIRSPNGFWFLICELTAFSLLYLIIN